jgi:hypothetical protein
VTDHAKIFHFEGNSYLDCQQSFEDDASEFGDTCITAPEPSQTHGLEMVLCNILRKQVIQDKPFFSQKVDNIVLISHDQNQCED